MDDTQGFWVVVLSWPGKSVAAWAPWPRSPGQTKLTSATPVQDPTQPLIRAPLLTCLLTLPSPLDPITFNLSDFPQPRKIRHKAVENLLEREVLYTCSVMALAAHPVSTSLTTQLSSEHHAGSPMQSNHSTNTQKISGTIQCSFGCLGYCND